MNLLNLNLKKKIKDGCLIILIFMCLFSFSNLLAEDLVLDIGPVPQPCEYSNRQDLPDWEGPKVLVINNIPGCEGCQWFIQYFYRRYPHRTETQIVRRYLYDSPISCFDCLSKKDLNAQIYKAIWEQPYYKEEPGEQFVTSEISCQKEIYADSGPGMPNTITLSGSINSIINPNSINPPLVTDENGNFTITIQGLVEGCGNSCCVCSYHVDYDENTNYITYIGWEDSGYPQPPCDYGWTLQGCEPNCDNLKFVYPPVPLGKESINNNDNVDAVQIIPNPSNGEFRIIFKFENKGLYDLEILDLKGNLIKKLEFNKQSTEFETNIDLKDLSSGNYYIKITKEQNIILKKSLIINK